MQALEADVKGLRAQSTRNQASLNELRAQLHKAESERYANGLVYGLLGLLALTLAAQGRLTAARAIVNAVLMLAMESGNPLLKKQTTAFEARFALLEGKQAAAYAWADRNPEMQPALTMIFLEMWEATFVRIRLAQAQTEHLEQARAMLAALRTYVWRTHIIVHQIDVLALEALLARAVGEPQAALGALRQALAQAAPAEIVRPFVDLGHEMATLLREAAQGGAQADFAAAVLAAFPDSVDPAAAARSLLAPPVEQAVPEPLTKRELEVLALLSGRLSYREIAAILVVSPDTVKKHAHNVYAKLAVNGRREAIARAAALGLVNPPI